MGAGLLKPGYWPALDDGTVKAMLSYGIGEKQLVRLYKIFKELDDNAEGAWTVDMFYQVISEPRVSIRAPIIDAVFFMGDRRGDGSMTFEEFLTTLITFCSLSREEVLQFFFVVIDKERDGRVSKKQIENYFSFVPVASGKKEPVFPVNNKSCLDKFRMGKWTDVEFDGLAQLCEFFPHIVFPAFHTQECFRKVILDMKHWEALDAERQKSDMDQIPKDTKIPGTDCFMKVKLPPKCTLQEIVEFSRRRTRVMMGKRVPAQQQVKASRMTKLRDEQISRCPLLMMIKNPKHMYHVPPEVNADLANAKLQKRGSTFNSRDSQRMRASGRGSEDALPNMPMQQSQGPSVHFPDNDNDDDYGSNLDSDESEYETDDEDDMEEEEEEEDYDSDANDSKSLGGSHSVGPR